MARGDAAVHVLESGPLGIEGQACLEFWYLVPVAANGSELRVLLKSSIGSVEIWTSPALPQNAWRQVFVLLNITERGTQVVFEAVQGLSIEKQITFKQIGVRRGSCGQQCESNTELWTDETTRCLCSAGQLSCFPSQCPEGQLCGPQRGGPDGTSTFGMCTIHSHTDGSTFDGVLFRFMATCTYVLAKTCSPTEALPMFSVEAVSEQNDNASLLNVQKINIDIGINRVSLLKSQTGRVVVNGVWRKLPLTLSSGTVNIKSNPATIVLDSTFGLTVSFDKAGAVHVTLPSTYSDKVCGMCGNFNHLKEDDFHNPNAQNVTALAESWQTGKTASSCEAILLPHQCDPLEKAEYASELYCGGLFSTTGPFADCLSVVQAESYFRSCVFGMCSTHGDPAVLSLQCGENSHYNSCADGCPKVCSTLDIAGSCGSCEARCECDSGFKLSGEKCVPEEDCGCWYNGKHYEKGETLVEGHCVQQCQCMGNNNMQCTKMQCGNNEVCKVKDGVKACFSFKSATCSVYGDPHYITYDRLAYDFQGGCSYILTTTCSGESSVQFTVFGHNMHPPLQNFTQSKLEAVALQVEDLHIILNQSGKVYVKYNHVQLPYSTSGTYGSVWVYVKNNYIILETTFGLRMQIDGKNRLFLQVDEHYKYELCGLCGTYSGYQDDDFVTPEGENLSEAFEFGDSWRVPNNSGCIAHPNDPRLCDTDEMDKASNECSALFGDAFIPCHEHIHPSIYLNSCVYDYCATSGDQHTLCESLQSYATACQVAGIELPNWQTGTVCDGHYMYIEASSVKYGDPARLISSVCSDPGPQCLQFWYHMYGSADTMGLHIYLLRNGTANQIWRKRNDQGNMWHLAQVDIEATTAFQIIIEGRRGSNDQSDVAIDDVKLIHGPCSAPPSVPVQTTAAPQPPIVNAYFQPPITNITVAPTVEETTNLINKDNLTEAPDNRPPLHPACQLLCNFEQDLCQWNQMPTDAFDWTRQSGSTPTMNTGPSSDHTTGDGHYLYIEANSASYGDTARFISSVCSDPGPQCLQFWYHMYGSADTMGLHIYLLRNGTANQIWKKRNDQGNMWHLAQVDIEATTAFQIIIEGRRGSNDQSDVAIDDINLIRGHCSAPPSVPVQTTAAPQPPIVNAYFQPPITNITVAPTVEETTNLINKDNLTEAPDNRPPLHPACQLLCNFEQDLCQWNQMPTDAFDWTRQRGSTPTMNTGPSSDHTTGDGHYLYIEANSASYGDTARFISSVCSDPGPQCLQFWYHMYGSADTMGLHIYLLQNRTANQIWKKRNDQGNMWHLAQVDIEATTAFQIIIEGRRGSNDQSDVAIDDINLIRGHCSAPPSVPVQTTAAPQPPIVHTSFQPPITNITVAPTVEETTNLINKDNLNEAPDNRPPLHPACQLLCNFEQDLCQWNQMPTDAFDWTRQSGSTPTMNTGPSSDHTTGDGHYLYIEANSASYGDTARFISSVCSDPGPQCLQFWYHMYGSADTMGLHIYLLQNRTANQIWKKRNDQGNMWHLAQVDIEATTAFQIIIEGRRGSNDQSDVAIDDINLIRGHCSAPPSVPVQTTAAPQPPIVHTSFQPPITNITVAPTVEETTNLINKDNLTEAPDNRPPLHPACQLLCNFEQDLCQWNQMPTDAFDWTRQSGSTPTMNTGPSSDHTTGDGHYLYIEANSASYGDTARFISSVCSDPGPQCLQFWYHMYGSADTMGLHIYLLRNGTANQIWKKRNDQGNMWHLAQVDIEATTAFQIIIEGRRGSNDQSDVAIDDINLIRGHCSAPPSVPVQTSAAPQPPIVNASFQPPITNITVAPTVEETTNLINKYNLTEAPDNRPPLHPACQLLCNFEQDLCQWNQMPTDAFDWTRQRGSTPTMNTGPSSDHTTEDGHYLYIEANSASYGDTARFISSVCSDPGPQCLQFWYHMYGSADTMGLHIYLLQNRTANQIWKKRNDQGNMWHLAQVDIEATTAFQIIIEGRRGSNDQSDVAIDDINLIRGHCSAPPSVPVQTTAAPQPPIVHTSFQPPITNITVAPTVEETTNLINKDNLNEAPDNRPPLHPACQLLCNFEQDLCQWNQMPTDAFDWTRQSGSTPTMNTGPSSDHTTGDGHYLYIEANSASYGDTARFISSVCSDPGPQCLQFWYHMYGSADTMGLHIYLLRNRTANQIWKKRNDQGNMWHLAQVDIEATTAFQIIIEGRRGSNDQSDVAIDDINLIRGHCSAPPSVPVQTTAAPQPPIVNAYFQPPITNITVAPTVEETTNLINKDNLNEAPDNRPPLHPACQLLCNFEQDLCQWNQMPTDAFDWTRQRGSTPTMNTGPSSDHTTGDGHYLYIEANSASYGDTARFISSVCSDPGPQCLQFWYHMYGSADTMGLHIYLLRNGTANQIWKKRNDQGNMWHLAQVDIEATTAFQIIIEGRRGSNDQSDVAIDDINLIRGHCSAPPSVPVQTTAAPQPPIVHTSFQPPITNITVAPTVEETTNLINKDNLNEAPDNRPPLHPACQLLCNFEQDLCQWNQMPTDAFDWTRQSGSTPTMNTGPSSDHTTGDGHYLYIEANSASYGDTARFISSVCSDPGPQCLQFWYHMYGSADTMGLHIYLLRNRTANQIWKKRNDQGNMWHLAQVDIEATTAFQIIIEGRRGSNDQSDVAIDDINLIRGHCSAPPSVPVQTSAAPQPPIVNASFQPPITNITVAPTVEETTNLINKDNLTEAPDNRPPLHPACQLLCNFEQDLCQWNQMPTDAFDWTRQSGSTPTMNTGPSSDHTTEDGHYLYIEANSASYGDTARFISSVCSDPGPQCLQFWYHMYGSADTMGLHIYLLRNGTANQIWKKRNDQGNMWHLAQVDIEATTAFQIIIEGRRGSNDQSDVAIDDINLIRGHCSAPPSVPVQTTAAPQPPIVNAYFQPPITNITVAPTVEETTNLINKDNLNEAPDNRPPLHPACQLLCNFEQDLCQWNQMPTDAFDWTRQRGSTPTMNTGPSSDHTTGDGHYLYIEANSASYGDTARFISSVCSDPGPQCLQFWYHMYGSADTMGLHIYLLRNGTANQIWKKRNDQGNMWHLAQVDIEATTAFQIIIEGRRGSNDQSDVAIDDINLIRGHCSAPPSVPVQTTAASQPPIVHTSFQPPITNITVAPTVEETTNLISKDNLTEASDNRPPLHPVCQLLCNFEQDLCQWNQMPTDAFDWTRQSGSTPTMNTGPSSDHTTGDGHYLYIEANSASYGDTARFISSVCSDPGPQCLQFWYHMYGSADTMGLHIYLIQNRTANQIWKKRNDQGNMWHLAQVDIEAIEEFQIIFEGRRGSNDQSDVAIDDVMLHRGQCAALSCPQNSHYATCVPACSPTCLYLNGPPHCSNNEACVPGCVCDDGFVLKSQVCVPLQQCGCVDRNGTKHQFNEKWYTDHCSEQCECEEDDGIGKIDCDDKDKCGGNAVCLQNENGNYYCQSTGFDECTIKGEYRTFDKMKHDFEGEHSYVLVRTSNLPNNLPDIYIEGINTPALGDRDGQHESESSIEEDQSSRVGEDDEEDEDEDDDNSKKQNKHHRLQELKIRVYNHTVEFKKNRNLIVDGKRTDTPISVTGGLKIWERSSRIYLQTDFGLSVEFDRHSTAEIVLPRIYRRKVGGLCGNFDGQKKNDKMKPDGTMARSTREFGESWRV
ncbi:MAM and LDL-receptor class A domain-containing protein 1-like [Archocentrus centrarchus]|uniref:MAM and LDL-receptor class A domain-containing protein 1-like n=1 Tax=Archocentrus centrarchus TaxID=63155 RepID=UPI0011EA3BD3|nr:MAM and LDL-receptor class A domain-containing protein 1-like [Archocentrus centrarchus]